MRGRCFLLAGLFCLALPASALAEVRVSFVDPAGYTDASLRGARRGAEPGSPVLSGLEGYLKRLGARELAPGQVLDIRVLDIDLAGEYRPWVRSLNEVRIADGLTPPRIRLEYRLRERGRTVLSASETVTDTNYLSRAGVAGASDSLRYEKAMLRDWFRRRLVRREAPHA